MKVALHTLFDTLNQAGMRWSRDGLDSVLALRCWVLNGRLDALCPKPHVPIEFKPAA